MRYILGFSFLLLFTIRSFGQGDKAVIDQLVATVGGEIILLSEVQEQLSYARQQQPNLTQDYNCVVLQNLIVQKLLVNQAKLDSIEVKDEEVESQIDARIERLMSYFNQDEKAIVEFYGMGLNDIKEQTRSDMRSQLLAERMQGKITEKATITPVEVQHFYARIPKDSLPYFNAEVEIREIVYKPPVNGEEKEKARAKVDELRTRIVGGEDFAGLAKKYSDDPGSGAQGGDLGWQKRGTFVPAFEAMAYNLEKGQLSSVVETEFGFHIMELLERRGNLIHLRHLLVKPEITSKDIEWADQKMDSVRRVLLDKKITFSEAVKAFGDKNIQSFHNDGRVTNPRSGNTFFEVADLETDVYFAIEGLKEGDISEPFEYRSQDGSRMFRLVLLQSRTKPHKANLKQDYGKIQTAALEQKKSEYTERWITEKLGVTHFSVSDLFGKCPNLREMISLKQ